MVQEIWQGPRYSGSQDNLLTGLPVWFGMEPGANLAGAYVPPPILGPRGGLGLATTYQLPSGQWAGAPFIPSDDWFQRWITQDPSFVYTDLTYQQYFQDFLKSGQMFDNALATDNPDLQAFRAHGGKLIMWQGPADQLIFTGDSINYYNHVLAANGGIASTQPVPAQRPAGPAAVRAAFRHAGPGRPAAEGPAAPRAGPWPACPCQAAARWLTDWTQGAQGEGSVVTGVVYSNAADAVSLPHLRARSVASLPGPDPARTLRAWEIRTRPPGAVIAQECPVGQPLMTAATISAIARTSVHRASPRPGLRAMCSPKTTIAAVLSSGHLLSPAAPSSTVMPSRIAVSCRRPRGPEASGSGID